MKVNKIIYVFSPFRHLFMAFKKMLERKAVLETNFPMV